MNINDEVKLSVNLESREYNGRWYTDVRFWKIEAAGTSSGSNNTNNGNAAAPPVFEDMSSSNNDSNDDLPF